MLYFTFRRNTYTNFCKVYISTNTESTQCNSDIFESNNYMLEDQDLTYIWELKTKQNCCIQLATIILELNKESQSQFWGSWANLKRYRFLIMAQFLWTELNCPKAREQLREDSLLLTTKQSPNYFSKIV